MSNDVDRFLANAPILSEGPSLGRVFAVERESWLLSEDPQATRPRIDLVVSRRTALDAADVARSAAAAFPTHGFHKASGCWWASDHVRFHRFAVRPKKTRRNGARLGPGVVALGALAALAIVNAVRSKGRRPRSRA